MSPLSSILSFGALIALVAGAPLLSAVGVMVVVAGIEIKAAQYRAQTARIEAARKGTLRMAPDNLEDES